MKNLYNKIFMRLIALLVPLILCSCNILQTQHFSCTGKYVDAWKSPELTINGEEINFVYPTDTRRMTLSVANDEVRIEGKGVKAALKICEKTDTHIKFSAYNGKQICQDNKDLSYQEGSYYIHTGEVEWIMNIGGRYVRFNGVCTTSKS